jgi:hypothetical protein
MHSQTGSEHSQTASKLILLFSLAFIVALRAGDLPEGDQYASGFTQDLDALDASYNVFRQRLAAARPVTEVARALDAFADDYDQLCARLAQFTLWYRSTKDNPARFSPQGQIAIQKVMTRANEFFAKAANVKPTAGYGDDPEVKAAMARLFASSTRLQELTKGQK